MVRDTCLKSRKPWEERECHEHRQLHSDLLQKLYSRCQYYGRQHPLSDHFENFLVLSVRSPRIGIILSRCFRSAESKIVPFASNIFRIFNQISINRRYSAFERCSRDAIVAHDAYKPRAHLINHKNVVLRVTRFRATSFQL